MMSKVASRSVTGLEVIAVPLSEWIVWGAIPPLASREFSMNCRASSPDSRRWISQCTTYREKMSIITYRS